MNKIPLLFLWCLLLVGCSQESKNMYIHHEREVGLLPKQKSERVASLSIQPIDNQNFIRVTGWWDDSSIIYIRVRSGSTETVRHNIATGEEEVLYTTSSPVVTVDSNHDHSLFLVVTQQMQYTKELIVVNHNGKKVFQQTFEAENVDINWSPYQTNEMLVSLYKSNQTTEVKKIQIAADSDVEALSTPPYVKWWGPDEVAYFKWTDGHELAADLVSYNLNTLKETLLHEGVIGYQSHKGSYMILQPEGDEIVFSFYSSTNKHPLAQLQVPMLKSNAGYYWTPQYEWSASKSVFYTFVPTHSTSILDYQNQYKLLTFDLIKKEQEVILNDIGQSAIKCAPSGEHCLYGQRLTNLLQLANRESYSLLNMSEG